MKHKIKYSIVIPAFNEEGMIGPTLKKLHKYLATESMESKTEVIVVVAIGSDDTLNEARKYIKPFTHAKIVEPGARAGKGRDVRAGVMAAEGEYIIFTDADLATPLHHIVPSFRILENGSDIVIGSRDLSVIHTGLRKAVSLAGNLITRTLINRQISDTQCGFKGFNRKSANALFKEQTVMGWAFDMELLFLARKKGFTVTQLSIFDWTEHKPPEKQLIGENNFKASLKTLREVIKIRLNDMRGRYSK